MSSTISTEIPRHQNLDIGNRVKLKSFNLVGTLAFVGSTDFANGKWYGIVLDQAKGKNNGSIDNRQYFQCATNHGLFVRKTELLPHVDRDSLKVTNSTMEEIKLMADLMNEKLSSLKVEGSLKPLQAENTIMHQKIGTLERKLRDHRMINLEQSKVLTLAQKHLLLQKRHLETISKLQLQLKWEREKSEKYETKLQHVSHMLEETIIEKELVEERLDKADDQLESLRADLEMCTTINCANENSFKEEIHQKDLLIRLHEGALVKLQEQVDEQVSKIEKSNEVTIALQCAEEIIETLVEKNAKLTQKNSELRNELVDYECLQDVDDQLEEALQNLEIEGRQEVQSAENKLYQIEKKLQWGLGELVNQNTVIRRFQELVKQLRSDNRKLNFELIKEPVVHFKRIPEAQRLEDCLTIANLKIELESADEMLQYWAQYNPESFFAPGGECDIINLIVTVDKLLKKDDLLTNQVHRLLPKTGIIQDEFLESLITGQLLLYRLYELESLLNLLQRFLDECHDCDLQRLGTLYVDVKIHAHVLDYYLDLFLKDEIIGKKSLDTLEKFVSYIRYIVNLAYEGTRLAFLNHPIKLYRVSCEFLQENLSLIVSLSTTNKLISWSNEMKHAVSTSRTLLSKFRIFIGADQPMSTSNDVTINSLDEIQKLLKECLDFTHRVLDEQNGTLSQDELNTTLEIAPKDLPRLLKSIDLDTFEVSRRKPKSQQTIIRRSRELKSAELTDGDVCRDLLQKANRDLILLRKTLKSKDEDLGLFRVRHDTLERDLKLALIKVESLKEQIIKITERNTMQTMINRIILQDMTQSHTKYKTEADELRRRLNPSNLLKLPPLILPTDDFLVQSRELYWKSEDLKHRLQQFLLPRVIDVTKNGNADATFRRQQRARRYQQESLQEEIINLSNQLSMLKVAEFFK